MSTLSDSVLESLIAAAREAQKLAYAPYSEYKVGAAILTNSGKVFSGSNVENASYGATICAERAAIANMIMGGERNIRALAVVTEDNGFPCGICLQTINEFTSDPKMCEIVVPSKSGFQIRTLQELAPYLWRSNLVKKTK